eukprot:6454613-Prymnesium_polylepis.1
MNAHSPKKTLFPCELRPKIQHPLAQLAAPPRKHRGSPALRHELERREAALLAAAADTAACAYAAA